MINLDYAFNAMRSDSRVNGNLNGVFRIFIVQGLFIQYFTNFGTLSLFWYFHLIDLNDIFVIKNSNGYRRVLLARPTVTSPNWIPVFLMQPLSLYMNSCQFKSVSIMYHVEIFDIHFMADLPLKTFSTPPFLPPWHDLISV